MPANLNTFIALAICKLQHLLDREGKSRKKFSLEVFRHHHSLSLSLSWGGAMHLSLFAVLSTYVIRSQKGSQFPIEVTRDLSGKLGTADCSHESLSLCQLRDPASNHLEIWVHALKHMKRQFLVDTLVQSRLPL